MRTSLRRAAEIANLKLSHYRRVNRARHANSTGVGWVRVGDGGRLVRSGAPGRAHGGMVAAVFDDVTGFVLRLASTAAYTGQLSVRYHGPVPIETPLEFRSRLEGRDGRKLRITADCRAGDQLVAAADTIYIAVEPHAFGRTRA